MGKLILKLVGAALALSAFAPLAHSQQVKHIILFIGDGMQLEAENAASRYLFGKENSLSFQKLPYKGNVATWDVTTYNRWAAQLGKPPTIRRPSTRASASTLSRAGSFRIHSRRPASTALT